MNNEVNNNAEKNNNSGKRKKIIGFLLLGSAAVTLGLLAVFDKEKAADMAKELVKKEAVNAFSSAIDTILDIAEDGEKVTKNVKVD